MYYTFAPPRIVRHAPEESSCFLSDDERLFKSEKDVIYLALGRDDDQTHLPIYTEHR